MKIDHSKIQQLFSFFSEKELQFFVNIKHPDDTLIKLHWDENSEHFIIDKDLNLVKGNPHKTNILEQLTYLIRA